MTRRDALYALICKLADQIPDYFENESEYNAIFDAILEIGGSEVYHE